MPHLSQQSHETRGRHHADLSRQGLSDGRPPLLLTAAIGVRLDRVQTVSVKETNTHGTISSALPLHLKPALPVSVRGGEKVDGCNSPLWDQSRSEPAGFPGGCISPAGSVSA